MQVKHDHCLTLEHPMADKYTIHVDDATIGTFQHWMNITLHIQCVVLSVKRSFRHSNSHSIEGSYIYICGDSNQWVKTMTYNQLLLCRQVRKDNSVPIMQLYYMINMAMPQHKNPCLGNHEILIFNEPFLVQYY